MSSFNTEVRNNSVCVIAMNRGDSVEQKVTDFHNSLVSKIEEPFSLSKAPWDKRPRVSDGVVGVESFALTSG